MPQIAELTLLAVAVLLIKHCVADFLLQTRWQVMNKGRYLHPGGLLHSFIHVVLTLPVFLVIVPATIATAALILGGEYVIHYHTDWLKDQLTRLAGLTPAMSPFWWLMGLDQLVHGLTYVAIVWVLLTPDFAARVLTLLGTA
ncbi:MAG: DUF3307 domain-containing protein [Hyphomicrobiaceae bacterium]